MRLRVKHLHRTKVGPYVYHRHRKTGERLDKDANGNPRTMEQIAARCMEINAQFQTPAQTRAVAGTLADLVTQYKKSHGFKSLAAKTRTSYHRSLDMLSIEYGEAMVHEITTEDILGLQQDWSDRPRTADLHVSVLQILLNFAIQRRSRYGNITFNPATKGAGVKRLHRTDGYEPWPVPLIETVRENAPDHVRWLIDMARFTGQRAGDLAAMRWSDIHDGALHVKQGKTGAVLAIPLYPALKDTLDGIGKKSLFILTNHQGKPWRVDAMSKAIAKVRPEGTAFVLHGLRKNATINLIEAGCTGEEVKSITGHTTDAMVNHYGRRVNQGRLARSAVAKITLLSERRTNGETD